MKFFLLLKRKLSTLLPADNRSSVAKALLAIALMVKAETTRAKTAEQNAETDLSARP